MTVHFGTDPFSAAKVLEMISQEREKALSPREWRHRIAGYGYGIKETQEGHMVTVLPHGTELCPLPDHLYS